MILFYFILSVLRKFLMQCVQPFAVLLIRFGFPGIIYLYQVNVFEFHVFEISLSKRVWFSRVWNVDKYYIYTKWLEIRRSRTCFVIPRRWAEVAIKTWNSFSQYSSIHLTRNTLLWKRKWSLVKPPSRIHRHAITYFFNVIIMPAEIGTSRTILKMSIIQNRKS